MNFLIITLSCIPSLIIGDEDQEIYKGEGRFKNMEIYVKIIA